MIAASINATFLLQRKTGMVCKKDKLTGSESVFRADQPK
jgi:hypothetical protein